MVVVVGVVVVVVSAGSSSPETETEARKKKALISRMRWLLECATATLGASAGGGAILLPLLLHTKNKSPTNELGGNHKVRYRENEYHCCLMERDL